VDNLLSLRVRCLVLLIALTAACGHNISGPSSAPTRFTGTVSDADTGGPIPGASVLFIDAFDVVRANAGLTAMTDSNGAYRFDNVILGNARLSANAIGYAERRTVAIDISSGFLNWQLRRIQAPITLTGQVSDRLPGTCPISKASVPCQVFPFSMRRSGSVDLTLTWAAGTDLTLEVVGGLVSGTTGQSGNAGTLHLNAGIGASGDYDVWVVNGRLAPGPIAFTVTLIVAD
jgi:hypothetical protein